jgi:hypothetical protein
MACGTSSQAGDFFAHFLSFMLSSKEHRAPLIAYKEAKHTAKISDDQSRLSYRSF